MYKTRSKYIQNYIESNDSRQYNNSFLVEADRLKVGTIHRGKLSQLLEHGAIVMLGSVRTYLHVSEIKDKFLNKPSEVLRVHQPVWVKVLSNRYDAKKRLSIRVSMKGVNQNPPRKHPRKKKPDYNKLLRNKEPKSERPTKPVKSGRKRVVIFKESKEK